jgi:hypothetical protein
MRPMHRSLAVAASLALALALNACANAGGRAADQPAAQAATKTADVPPPAGSKLAKVKIGMNDVDVRKALGEPTSAKNYMTGKQWIPFYWGPDTGRTDWMYKGQGRVVFSRNRYSGGLKVIKVSYDPHEKGA